MDLQQSVPLCLVLSALGGAIEVFATAILAYQEANEKQTGIPWPPFRRYTALSANVFLQLVSSLIGNLFAPWFGPVSLVGPVFLSSQLVANLIVFGAVLGLESFTKDMRVGTYFVVLAVALLPVVGPGAQHDQDITDLLSNWYSLLWSSILVVLMVISVCLMACADMEKSSEPARAALILGARSSAFAINLTVSKVMVLDVSLALLVFSISLKIASGAIITYALVVQSTAVSQAKFVPLNATALILVNGITGMIIWEDWKVVGSWVGYCCVFIQLILGNYLLLGVDVEFLGSESAEYGTVKSLEMARATIRVGSAESALASVKPDGDYDRYEEEATGGADGGLTTRRQFSTKRQAWSSVYNVEGPKKTRYRQRSIFAIDENQPTTSSNALQGLS